MRPPCLIIRESSNNSINDESITPSSKDHLPAAFNAFSMSGTLEVRQHHSRRLANVSRRRGNEETLGEKPEVEEAYPVRRTARQPASRCPTDALGSGKAKATWYGWHRALKSGVLRAQKSPSTLCLQRTRAGAPYQIRTGDPLFTRQMLWPAELRRRGPTNRGRIDPG